MTDKVIEALKHARYRVLTEDDELEEIYRLRYKCYRAENSIPENEHGLMTDDYDNSDNCVHVAVDFDGQIAAAVRLHLVSKLTTSSPTLEVFPELLDKIAEGVTLLDSTRFVIHPSARMNKVPLHFLVLRIPFLATIFYDIDMALAPVRSEHTGFYCRYLGYERTIKARGYPGLAKPVHLLTAKVREQRAAVLSRTPAFGPVDTIPHSGIAFPKMSGVYVATKRRRSTAA